MIHRNMLFGLKISALVVGLMALTQSGEAEAAYRRVHSSVCHYWYDDAGSGLYNGAYLSVGTTGRGIYCPAPSDSLLPHSSAIYLNVHGYAPSTSNYSRACVKSYNSSAYTCGTAKYWPAGYGGVYGVSVSAWTGNAPGFPVVYNYLPPSAVLYGFYIAN
jgi:hypothetical protein